MPDPRQGSLRESSGSVLAGRQSDFYNARKMKIVRLSESEFWDRYKPLCKPIEGLGEAEEQEFSEAIDRLDAKLKEALSTFDEDEDYQTACDWNPCWHHCGGVFGKAAFSPEFLKKIVGVLATEQHPWCFHLACEPAFEGLEAGQLFIHAGEVFADASDSLDYSVFESNQERAKAL